MRLTVVCPACGREVTASRLTDTTVRPEGHLTPHDGICVSRPPVNVEFIVAAMPSDRLVLATLARLLGRELRLPFVSHDYLALDGLVDDQPQLVNAATRDSIEHVRAHVAVAEEATVESRLIRAAELVKTDASADPESFILGPRDAYTAAIVCWWERPA
jgi:hypothetical protein